MTFEYVKGGLQDSGWYDITVVGSGHQEQYRRVDGVNQLRHRPIEEMIQVVVSEHITCGRVTVATDEPWVDGAAPNGAGRNLFKHAQATRQASPQQGV